MVRDSDCNILAFLSTIFNNYIRYIFFLLQWYTFGARTFMVYTVYFTLLFNNTYLYYIKRKIHNTNLISTSIIWLIILGCIFIIMKLYKSYFKPEIISCYIIGYAIADIFSRFKRNNIRNKITFIICMAAIVFNAIKIYYCYFYKSELAGVFALIFAYFKSYTHVVLGLSIFLLFIHLCNNVKYNKILSFSDKYSYEIYLVHALFILSPLNLIFISDYVILNIVMAIVSTIICGMLLKYISSYISSVKFI